MECAEEWNPFVESRRASRMSMMNRVSKEKCRISPAGSLRVPLRIPFYSYPQEWGPEG